MAETSRFWDRIADKYARSPITHEDDYQTKLTVTRSYMRPDMKVLEFGCGTGGTAIAHAPFVEHIRAIDFSPVMLDKARQKMAQAAVENVVFERADITSEPLPQSPYDMVLGLSILHLLRNPEAIVTKVYQMLAPGGYFVTSTACLGDNMAFFRYIVPVGRALGVMPYVNVMTTEAVIAMLKSAGFEIAHRWKPAADRALFVVARRPV